MKNVFPDTKKKTGVKMLGKLLRKRLVLKKIVIDDFQKLSLHVSAISER